MVNKAVGLVLASLLAVLVLSGQACAQRLLVSDSPSVASDPSGGLVATVTICEDKGSSNFDSTEFRSQAASVLGVSLDRIGTMTANVSSDSEVVQFQILPESGNFNESEVNHIRDVLTSGELGTLTSLSFNSGEPVPLTSSEDGVETDPITNTTGNIDNTTAGESGNLLKPSIAEYEGSGYLVATLTISGEGSEFNSTEYKQNMSSILDVSPDQVSNIKADVTIPGNVVVEFEVHPESDGFNGSEFIQIKDALESGELGTLNDLRFSTGSPVTFSVGAGVNDTAVVTVTTEDHADIGKKVVIGVIAGVGGLCIVLSAMLGFMLYRDGKLRRKAYLKSAIIVDAI